MALTATVTPGKQFASGETVDTTKLNLLGVPTVQINGTLSTAELDGGAVTAAKSKADAYWYATTGGTAAAYTLDLGSGIRPDSLANGVIVRAKLHTGCAATPTLTVVGSSGSNLTTKEIRRPADAAVNANDFATNQIVDFTYNSDGDGGAGAWIIQSIPNANAAGSPIVANARNIIIKNNAATPATKIDVDADSLTLVDTNNNGFLATSVDLTIDATTNGANGLDTGSLAAGWYYVYVIYNGSTTAGLISTNAALGFGSLPSGYTHKALVGIVRATSGSNIRRFYQYERDIYIAQTEISESMDAAADSTWEILAGAQLTTFRETVPPIAKWCTLIWSALNNTNGLRIATASCNDDGTVATATADLVGPMYLSIPNVSATWTMASNVYGAAGTVTVPVRGGASYNIQWAVIDHTVIYRLEVTAFKI